MSSSQIPVARKEGLVIQDMADEVLVYDLTTNKAHCLNQTAAAVWKSCDGKRSVADISKLLNNINGGVVHEDLIWLAIDQLNEASLLETELVVNFNNQNRREVLKKVSLAAVIALPIVTSLVAPTVASAGSTCPASTACTCTYTANGGVCNGGGTPCVCSSAGGSGTGNCPGICPGGCTCNVADGSTGMTCSSTCT
jgi:Coenzyme PQQ synthesis protein D (PqqD)